jgi:hypothetical protein
MAKWPMQKFEEKNRKSVSKNASRKSGGNESSSESESSDNSSSEESDSSSDGSLSESLSSEFSSGSEGSDSSDSGGGRSVRRAAKKRDSRGLETPSQRVSRTGEAKRASRYVRQLELALGIDASWAREIYEECAAQGTTSYDGLLRYFYRHEVQHAKGTQRETTRALSGEQQRSPAAGGEFNVSMPTFQLPEWGSGQPPNGGVHFSTLQKMLEAYEKYDKQTNFKTQVTFKSMVNHLLKPNFESKCKLPETVWLPPREDDWMRIAEGKPERGGWSDMRFLKRVRRVLRPKGRTNYEIAFEALTLRHKGNDEQLTVSLDLWGTKWLAKEREAADEGKALPALKMKSYFKKAVAGVPRFGDGWKGGRLSAARTGMGSCVGSCIRRWDKMPKQPTTRNAKGSIGSTAGMVVGAGRIAEDMEDREVGQLVGAAPIEEGAAGGLPRRLPVLPGCHTAESLGRKI